MQKYCIYFNYNHGRLILLILRLVGLNPIDLIEVAQKVSADNTLHTNLSALRPTGLIPGYRGLLGRQYEILIPEIHNEYTIEYLIYYLKPSWPVLTIAHCSWAQRPSIFYFLILYIIYTNINPFGTDGPYNLILIEI